MVDNQLARRVTSIPTSGIRVIFERAAKMEDVVRLEIGEPGFATPNHIKEAAKKALDENWTHYTTFSGLLELREAIATKMKSENGVDADPETEVIVTSGACCAVALAMMATINPGEKVLVPDPGWPVYEGCVKMVDGISVHYSLRESNNFRIDVDELREKVSEKTKLIIINSPNNPTGSVLTKKELEAIRDFVLENDLLVLSDEVYEKIIYDGVKHYSIGSFSDMKEHTITVNSFSKTYAMTGWRLGYAIARSDIIEQMSRLNLHINTCASSIAQRAGIAALKGPQDCVARMVKEYERRRDYLVKSLNEIDGFSCLKPEGAFYVFPNVSGLNMTSFDCSMFLLNNARVATTPGNTFGNLGEGYIRLSYANSLDNLRKAITRIQRACQLIKR